MADNFGTNLLKILLAGGTGFAGGYGQGRIMRSEREERERREEEERRRWEAQLALDQAREDRLLSGQRFGERQAKQAAMLDTWNRMLEPHQERQAQRQAGREAEQEQEWMLERIAAQREPRPIPGPQMRDEGWWRGGEEPQHMQIPSGQRMVTEGDWRRFQPYPGTQVAEQPETDVSSSQIIQLLRMAEEAPMEPGEAVEKFQGMQYALTTPFDEAAARADIARIVADLLPGYGPLDEADIQVLLGKYQLGGPNAVRQWLLVNLGG